MTLGEHVVLAGAAAAALAPFCGWGEIAVFAVGAVLIDVDHYFLYVQRRRRFGVRGMFRYFEELQPIQQSISYVGLCIFHTADFFLLLALLSWHFPPLRFLLLGCLYHFLIDLYHLRRNKIPFIRAYFLIEHLLRRRLPGYPWY